MSNLVLLDFHAEWCGPCKSQDSILEELSDDYPDLEIRKIDVEEDGETANEYSVRSLPTLLFLEENEEETETLERFVGLTEKDELAKLVEEHL